MKKALSTLKKLESKDITYCHWKSNEHLKDGLEGSTDLDILVSDSCRDKCYEVLENSQMLRVFNPSWATYPDIEDWIGFDQDTGRLFHIHLHFGIILGRRFVKEITIPWSDQVLKTRVIDKATGVYVIDPNLELVILSLRIGLKTSYLQILKGFLGLRILPENILNELEYLFGMVDRGKLAHYLEEFFDGKGGKSLQGYIYKLGGTNSCTNIWYLKRFTNRYVSRYMRVGRTKSFLKYFVRSLIIKTEKVLSGFGISSRGTKKSIGKYGAIISVLGADGSGKSTLCGILGEFFSWKIATKRVYLGRHWLFRTLEGLKHSIFGHSNNCGDRVAKKRSFFKLIIDDIHKVLNARGRYIGLRKALSYRSKGYIVITDRFPQSNVFGINDGPSIDIVLSSSFIHKACFNYERRIYEKMGKIDPDMVIKLDIKPEVAHSRKPNHRLEEVARKAELIRQLSFDNTIVRSIDTSDLTKEQTAMEAKKIIWSFLKRKK